MPKPNDPRGVLMEFLDLIMDLFTNCRAVDYNSPEKNCIDEEKLKNLENYMEELLQFQIIHGFF